MQLRKGYARGSRKRRQNAEGFCSHLMDRKTRIRIRDSLKRVEGLLRSYFIRGSITMPETAVGIPMTIPENVEVPPKCFAYSLDEDTIMKNDSLRSVNVSYQDEYRISSEPGVAHFLLLSCTEKLNEAV
jgi:hypothetical protein